VPVTSYDGVAGTCAGATAVVLCPGPTLARYDDAAIPERWVRIVAGVAIQRCPKPRYWVSTSTRAVRDMVPTLSPATIAVVASGDAGLFPDETTVVVRDFADVPFDELAAAALARHLGCTRILFFGYDCYRTRDKAAFLGRKILHRGDRRRKKAIPRARMGGEKAWLTPHDKRVRARMETLVHSPAFDGTEVWCVDSPFSQQDAVPPMDVPALARLIEADRERHMEPVVTEEPPVVPQILVPLPDLPRRRARREEKKEEGFGESVRGQ
jgi:hypothetical protein